MDVHAAVGVALLPAWLLLASGAAARLARSDRIAAAVPGVVLSNGVVVPSIAFGTATAACFKVDKCSDLNGGNRPYGETVPT